MISNEQKAHDLAVAIATCTEQAKQNAILAANMKQGNQCLEVNVDPDDFISLYKVAYDTVLSSLER